MPKKKTVEKRPKPKAPEKVLPEEALPEPEKLVPKEDEARLQPPPEEVITAPVEKDYLRKYQFKNVNNLPTVGGPLTDPDKGSKAEIMKNSLLSQPRVNIFVPRAEKEDATITLSVNLNGYRLDFPKNVYLEVPHQIAEVIRDSLNQRVAALLPFQIGRDKATEDALS